MLNTNFNAYYVQQPLFYPFGYQYFIMPTPMVTQIINPLIQINDNLTQANKISNGLDQEQGEQKQKIISETESHLDCDSDDEQPRDITFNYKQIKSNISKNIQKPNLLVKSTNIQKNYAKAIVSYACRQRIIIFEILGEERGQEFIKLMNRLKNKLKNIAHITKYTHIEDFLSLFRVLGNNFMKKDSVSYIYNSKIMQKSCHLQNMTIVKNSILKY